MLRQDAFFCFREFKEDKEFREFREFKELKEDRIYPLNSLTSLNSLNSLISCQKGAECYTRQKCRRWVVLDVRPIDGILVRGRNRPLITRY